MKQVDIKYALEFVAHNKLCYFNEYLSLLQEECTAFSNQEENTFLLVQSYAGKAYATLIGDDVSYYSYCLEKLMRDYAGMSLVIAMPAGETLKWDEEQYANRLRLKQVYKTFQGTGLTTVYDNRVRKLHESDAELVEAFPEEDHKNMIPLIAAFKEFVLKGEGEIYGFVNDEGKLAGYLSCSLEIENIWDVVFLYVSPEYRSQGVGRALAGYYKTEKEKHGQIPYYSGVSNPASERVALNSGFVPCGKRYVFEG